MTIYQVTNPESLIKNEQYLNQKFKLDSLKNNFYPNKKIGQLYIKKENIQEFKNFIINRHNLLLKKESGHNQKNLSYKIINDIFNNDIFEFFNKHNLYTKDQEINGTTLKKLTTTTEIIGLFDLCTLIFNEINVHNNINFYTQFLLEKNSILINLEEILLTFNEIKDIIISFSKDELIDNIYISKEEAKLIKKQISDQYNKNINIYILLEEFKDKKEFIFHNEVFDLILNNKALLKNKKSDDNILFNEFMINLKEIYNKRNKDNSDVGLLAWLGIESIGWGLLAIFS